MKSSVNTELEFDFSDVINYWMSLFPEVKNINEFEEISKEVRQKNLKDLEQEWIKEEDKLNKSEIEISDLFNPVDDNKMKKIESIFDKNKELYGDIQFLNFFKPIVKYYIHTYYDVINDFNILENKEQFLKNLIIKIIQLVYPMAYRTIILEINVAKHNDLLIGKTSEERFVYFQNSLLNDTDFLKDLYTEYRHLTLLMKLKIRNYLEFIIENLKNTSLEIKNLALLFNQGKELGSLIDIETGSGDTHQSGKSVSILHFTSGIKLVYKPRNLDFEEGYYNLLKWINEQKISGMKKLKAAKTYSIQGSGWMEYIKFEECTNEKQVAYFYNRIGHLLCILHALNAKDFHSENLIASSEHPVLIDLESLIHGELEEMNQSKTNAINNCNKRIDSSVLSILLLPSRLVTKDKSDVNVFDLGGVGGDQTQLAPFKSETIQNNNSDNLRVVRDYMPLEPRNNNPKLNNHNQKIESYINEIQEGFTQTYQWIMANKEMFICKINELFSNKICRIIFKPTFVYTRLLRSSYHPDLLRNSMHRKILLHRISLYKYMENYEKISRHEFKDLLIGDIPYFTTNTSLEEITDSKGQIIENLNLKNSPLESVFQKIQNFSIEDLNEQIKFIDLSFIHTENKKDSLRTNTEFSIQHDFIPISKKDQYESLVKIGNHLLENSITGKENLQTDRTWIGLMMYGKEEITTRISPVEYDLYKGNSGIALFLGYLGVLTDDNKFKEAAIESMRPCIEYVKIILDYKKNNMFDDENFEIGAFAGVSGIFYTLFHLGKILNNKEFIDFTYENIDFYINDMNTNKRYDIIGGLSGYLGVILSIYNKTADKSKKSKLLNMANQVYQTIEDGATYYSDDSVFWGSNLETEGYTGFAHGTSGISAMLMRLYAINKNPNILKLIEKSLNYERLMFNAKDENWYINAANDATSIGWCHGAPGILLNRLILKQNNYYDDFIDHEIQIALSTTIKLGFGNNDTLCHGDLGNLDILQYAADILGDSFLKNRCLNTYNEIYTDFINEDWNEGYFRSICIYGLMVGLSGCGYSILKNGSDLSMPGILWLE